MEIVSWFRDTRLARSTESNPAVSIAVASVYETSPQTDYLIPDVVKAPCLLDISSVLRGFGLSATCIPPLQDKRSRSAIVLKNLISNIIVILFHSGRQMNACQ